MFLKVEGVNPFLQGVYSLIGTMLNSSVKRVDLGLTNGKNNQGNLMVMVGVSGKVAAPWPWLFGKIPVVP
jgi:CheY-specific phosphatase CheX